MRPAIDFEDVVVEIFHAQAQPGDAQLADDLELVIGQGARLALESNLLGLVPGQQRFHAIGQVPQLVGRKVRGRAAAEVDEIGLATADKGFAGVKREFAKDGINVMANRLRILVGINLEITEMATLAAKRNVNIDAEGCIGLRRPLDRGKNLAGELRFPERIGRIIGDEIIADSSFFLQRRRLGWQWNGDRGHSSNDSFPLLSKTINAPIIRPDYEPPIRYRRRAADWPANFVRPKLLAFVQRHHIDAAIVRTDHHFVTTNHRRAIHLPARGKIPNHGAILPFQAVQDFVSTSEDHTVFQHRRR